MPYLQRVFIVFLCASLWACSTVQPWERGTLAKPEMAAEPMPVKGALDRHVYFSKEGASGGGRAAGGGCGCN